LEYSEEQLDSQKKSSKTKESIGRAAAEFNRSKHGRWNKDKRIFITSTVNEDEVGASAGFLRLEGDVELVEALAPLTVGLGVLDPAMQRAPVLQHPKFLMAHSYLPLSSSGGVTWMLFFSTKNINV